MPTIRLETFILAPPERVFDLARSIEMHMETAGASGERAVAGVMQGLIGPNEEVTWSARHFGVRQRLQVRMTTFDRPRVFADVMVKGAFRRMEHTHRFEPSNGGTVMSDVFTFESPLGFVGAIGDRLFLERYMRTFLVERNRILKATAESDAWQRYVPDEVSSLA